MENSELNFISVETIEFILFQKNQLYPFLFRNKSHSVDYEKYVNAINAYMSYIIKNQNNIPVFVFDKVNFINAYFRTGIYFSYDEYWQKEKIKIDFAFLKSILEDEELFNKFMNYEVNKEFFGSLPFDSYLISFSGMFNYFTKNSLKPNPLHKKRYTQLIAKFSPTNVVQKSIKPAIPSEVESELEKKILSGINLKENKMFLARLIYIKLCKLLRFDVSYIINDRDLTKYKKTVNEVNLSDNEVICTTWSIIYSKLLRKVGIDSNIVGTDHRYVTFECDGVLFKADATDGYEDELGFKFTDLARVQLGLSTKGFGCVDPSIDITPLLEEIDEKIEFENKKTQEKMDLLQQKYISLSSATPKINISLEEKLDFFTSLSNQPNVQGLEYVSYLTMVFKSVFNLGEQEKVKAFAMGEYVNEKYEGCLLLVIDEKNDYTYYLNSMSKKGVKLNQHELEEMLNSGMLIAVSKSVDEIPGINMENKNEISL